MCAKYSGVSWCDHTFNIAWGCVEVSPECDDCYARWWSERTGYTFQGAQGFEIWGNGAPRRTFGAKHWKQPEDWNRTARKEFGRPARVFCSFYLASSDVPDGLPFSLPLWLRPILGTLR